MKNMLNISVKAQPPTESEITLEAARLKHVYKKCLLIVWSSIAFGLICAWTINHLHGIIFLFTMIGMLVLACFAGRLSGLNDKGTLNKALKNIMPITAENFPEAYYELSVLAERNSEVNSYLISVAKLGRAPIYQEYLMLKDWDDREFERNRLKVAESFFDHINNQADRSFNTINPSERTTDITVR